MWLERARIVDATLPYIYARLAAAEALRGHSEFAAAALAEAPRRSANAEYASIARLRVGSLGDLKIRSLYDAIYFAGVRLEPACPVNSN